MNDGGRIAVHATEPTNAHQASSDGQRADQPAHMKLLSVSSLLAAMVFSAVVVIPFLPFAKSHRAEFALEVAMSASVAGHAKIYYDIGTGYNEAHAAGHALAEPGRPHVYRFPLPAATYRSLRLDLIDRAGSATLVAPPRVIAEHGRIVREIALADVHALQQVESLQVAGKQLQMVATTGADDPQLVVNFSPPLVADFTTGDAIRGAAKPMLGVFAASTLLLVAGSRVPRLAALGRHLRGWLQRKPAGAVMSVAAAAVVASAYPIVFLGMSHVSPNFGTTLLYEGYPSLPGYSSTQVSPANGTDVGAAMWQHVPYGFTQRRALAEGELPLWNRYTLTGTPLLGQAQSMLGDPLHGIVLLFNGASWAWDVKYLLAKWLFAAGVGMLVLTILRRQDTGGPAEPATLASALLVAAAAPFIGFYIYRINHPAIFGVGYAPWVLFFWIQLAGAAGRRSVAFAALGLLAANFALMNSGTVKEAFVLLLLMNATGVGVLLATASPWRTRLARLGIAAWAGVLLALVTAPVWATFLHALQHAFTVSSHGAADQIQPALLLGAFDELFFRPLSKANIVFNPSLNFLLLLGMLYFAATLRLHFSDRVAIVLAVFTALAMAVVFGVVPPRWIAGVPLIGNVGHIENCVLCGLLVLWSVLAGIGFRTAAARLPTAEGRRDLLVAALLLAAIVGAWIGFRQAAHRSAYGPGSVITVVPNGEVIAVPPFVWASLAALLLAGVGLALAARRAMGRGRWEPPVAIIAALCVVVLLWRHGQHAAAVGFEPFVVRPPARAPFNGRSPAIEQVQARHAREPGRIFGLHGNVTPGWNAVYGLEAIHGPDALQHRWLRELIDVSPMTWNSAWRVYLASHDVAKARPFLDVLNVRFYLDLGSNPPPVDSSLQRTHSADLEVFESRTTWPRAFFTNEVVTYAEPAKLMQRFLSSHGQPFAAVHEHDATVNQALAALAANPRAPLVSPATDYTLTTNTTSFNVRAHGPGVIALHEAWWPQSFRAEINGRRVPIVRVNHAFKGVLVDAAGDYRVSFRYWPRHFTRNLALAATGLLLLVSSLFFALRPARPA